MKLLNLKAENLFCLGNIELDLKERGLLLITGHSIDEGGGNGSGKSSLANKAILWTLFGATAGGLRADNVKNRHIKKKGCFGEVSFEGTDGKKYRVKRERPAKLSLYQGKTDLSTRKASETQTLIDSLLGIDFKTFVQTAFFGQGRAMSYASLPPKDQKAVLEQALPMDQVDIWASYANAKLKEVSLIGEEAKTKVIEAQMGLNVLNCNKKENEERFSQWRKAQDQVVRDLKNRLKDLDSSLHIEQEKINIMKEQVKGFDREATETQIASLVQEKQDLLAVTMEASSTNLRAAEQSKFEWGTRRDYLRTEIDSLVESTSCPTCLRDFDDQTVKGIKKRITQQKILVEEASTNFFLAIKAYEYYKNEGFTLGGQGAKLTQTIQDLNNAINRHVSLSADITVAVGKVDKARYELVNKIAFAEEQENPYVGLTESMDVKIAEAEVRVLDTNKTLGKINGEVEHLSFWANVYSKELKLKLFEDACPFLDARTRFHLDHLKNRQINVQFSTIKRLATGGAKEEFNVDVWSETGGFGFDSLSGGEQQMVSFAIGLSLSDLSSRTAMAQASFLILDEPFSELDARNSEAIVEYLTGEMGKDKDTVFLISNEESLKGLIPNTVHVVKERGVTHVE